MQNKIKWAEERRYINVTPREDGVIKFADVDVEVDGVRVTGVARHNKYIVLRMRRGATSVYVFYELFDGIDKNVLTDAEFIKRLLALDFENEIIKKRIEELRGFADRLEERLRGLPVAITVMSINNKSHGHVEVKLARQVDGATFQRYVSTCKSLNMRFDSVSRVWVYVPEWSQYVVARYCGTQIC